MATHEETMMEQEKLFELMRLRERYIDALIMGDNQTVSDIESEYKDKKSKP